MSKDSASATSFATACFLGAGSVFGKTARYRKALIRLSGADAPIEVFINPDATTPAIGTVVNIKVAKGKTETFYEVFL
jgi:hypothetical protein